MDTSDIEWALAKLLAVCNDSVTYHWTMGADGIEHLIETDLPDGVSINLASDGSRIPYYFAWIAPQCTYVYLAALVIPFAVTKITPAGLILRPLVAIAVVAMVNFVRLQLLVTLSRAGVSWVWSHDVPHYTAYTLTIAGAVWYYYRSTKPAAIQERRAEQEAADLPAPSS